MKLIPVQIPTTIDYPTGKGMTEVMMYARRMAKVINDFGPSEYNIWVRGSSGAIIGALFYSYLNRKIIKAALLHIKKPNEDSHTVPVPEPIYKKNIIIDDFMASGATINSIYYSLRERNPKVKIDYLIVENGRDKSDLLNFKPEILLHKKPIW